MMKARNKLESLVLGAAVSQLMVTDVNEHYTHQMT